MTDEQALALICRCLPQQHLNQVQEIVFRASWQGQSYVECAEIHGYSPEYIKAVGYKLWNLLSLTFKKQVTKNNFQSILRQHLLTHSELKNTEVKSATEELTELQEASWQTVHEAPIFKSSQNWGQAVDISEFYGRSEELITLERWIEQERCRLIGIFGMGGIGKTALACKLAKQIQGKFDFLWWRSLSDTPPLEDLLFDLIHFLSKGLETKADLPKSIEGQILRLIDYLRSSRCLVILDNVETILGTGNHATAYRQGYEGYGVLWKQLGELDHQSTIILSSQEKPREVELIEGERLPVRSLKLCGFKEAEGRAIFEKKGSFSGEEKEWKLLMQLYTGNPLFLKIVASVIENLFDSNIGGFINLGQQSGLVFDEIYDSVNCQFNRLSDLEKSVMYWLAINREPVSLQELRDDLFLPQEKQKLPDVLRSLERRCLIDKATPKLIEKSFTYFTLSPVLMEYVTQRFIEQICNEIEAEEITLLKSHALIKAKSKESARESQNRAILIPIVKLVLGLGKSYQDIECKLNLIFLKIREKLDGSLGYAVGNLINLSSQLNISSIDFDFSQLMVWENEFQNVDKLSSSQADRVGHSETCSYSWKYQQADN